MNMIMNFLKDEEGASLVEYALLITLITAAVAATILTLGGNINTVFNRVVGLIN